MKTVYLITCFNPGMISATLCGVYLTLAEAQKALGLISYGYRRAGSTVEIDPMGMRTSCGRIFKVCESWADAREIRELRGLAEVSA